MKPDIGRRDFLKLGSTGLAYAAALGPLPLTILHRERVGISVGYWMAPPDEDHGSEEAPFRADVVRAERLRHGDPAFLRRGARVTIHGVVEPGRSWLRPELENLSVFANFRIPGGATIRNLLWQMGRTPVLNVGAPVSFTVPVEENAGLCLEVQRSPGRRSAAGIYREPGAEQPGAGERQPAQEDLRLTVDRRLPGHRLQRGTYLVAGLNPGVDAAPSWERYQFRSAPDDKAVGSRRLVRRDLSGLVPAEFDYLVIDVEYAG